MKKIIEKIAKEVLHFDTLETRNSDSLDFKDTAVWSVKTALEAAYKAGQEAKEKEVKVIKEALSDMVTNADEDCPSEHRTEHFRTAMENALELLK